MIFALKIKKRYNYFKLYRKIIKKRYKYFKFHI